MVSALGRVSLGYPSSVPADFQVVVFDEKYSFDEHLQVGLKPELRGLQHAKKVMLLPWHHNLSKMFLVASDSI